MMSTQQAQVQAKFPRPNGKQQRYTTEGHRAGVASKLRKDPSKRSKSNGKSLIWERSYELCLGFSYSELISRHQRKIFMEV